MEVICRVWELNAITQVGEAPNITLAIKRVLCRWSVVIKGSQPCHWHAPSCLTHARGSQSAAGCGACVVWPASGSTPEQGAARTLRSPHLGGEGGAEVDRVEAPMEVGGLGGWALLGPPSEKPIWFFFSYHPPSSYPSFNRKPKKTKPHKENPLISLSSLILILFFSLGCFLFFL